MEVKFIVAEKSEINEIEKSIVGWGSKPTPDRDKELIESTAWKLDTYKSNPVLMLSHDYASPPIGKVLWVKADAQGLRFKARFANSERGREIYELYKDGIMNAFSVGFSPKIIDTQPDKDIKYKGMNLKKVFKEVDLLEISCVSIPANSNALVEYVKSGKIRTKALQEEFDNIIEIIESKSVDEVKEIDEIEDLEIESTEEIKEIDKVEKTEDIVDETIETEKAEDVKAIEDEEVKEVEAEKEEIKDVDENTEEVKEVDDEEIEEEIEDEDTDDEDTKGYSDWTETDNEEVYLVKDPEDFDVDTLKLVSLKKSSPSISAMMGESLEDGKIEIQSLLFPKEEWAQDEAESWLADHSIKSFNIAFETLSEDISEVLIDFKESIMDEVKGLANKDTEIEKKKLDIDKTPSVQDILSAIRNQIEDHSSSPEVARDNYPVVSPPVLKISRYLIDLYPIDYPNGYCVIGTYSYDTRTGIHGDNTTKYYRTEYIYDAESKLASLGEFEEVEEGWVLKKYDGVSKIVLGEIKKIEKEIEEVNDEIEIEIEEKGIKEEIEDIEIEDDDGLVEVDSDSLQKAITDVFLNFKKEDIIKNSSIKEIANDAINKARGRVIMK